MSSELEKSIKESNEKLIIQIIIAIISLIGVVFTVIFSCAGTLSTNETKLKVTELEQKLITEREEEKRKFEMVKIFLTCPFNSSKDVRSSINMIQSDYPDLAKNLEKVYIIYEQKEIEEKDKKIEEKDKEIKQKIKDGITNKNTSIIDVYKDNRNREIFIIDTLIESIFQKPEFICTILYDISLINKAKFQISYGSKTILNRFVNEILKKNNEYKNAWEWPEEQGDEFKWIQNFKDIYNKYVAAKDN